MTIAALPMYDWPEVAGHVDSLWAAIKKGLHAQGIEAPEHLTRVEDLEKIWRDPTLIIGQVCSLNPVRDGLGETEVLGTLEYESPPGLPHCERGGYYSVLVGRRSDVAAGRTHSNDFRGARVAANGTDSQSGYWSLGHLVRDRVSSGPFFGPVTFTGAHRDSILSLANGETDLAAVDVHSWRLALDHETAVQDLVAIETTAPTPGVVCVSSWELAHLRRDVNTAIGAAVETLIDSETLRALHITGYSARRMEDFQVVADQVEWAAQHPWHL